MTWHNPVHYLPRVAERHLMAVLQTQPVAVIMGARQSGKSTLVANSPATRGLLRLTLDDLDTRLQALSDPEGLVARADRLAIDEVQRAPDVLIAIKRAVDLDRTPGRFVLTGSANLLAMKPVKETLAGRASFVSLVPLTRREGLGLGTAGIWDTLIDTPVREWSALLASQDVPPDDWRTFARRSGYPPVVIGKFSPAQQADWLQGYLDTFVSRDISDIAQVTRPLDLLRLMRAACVGLGQVEHQSAWAEATGLSTSSVSRWTDLLTVAFQLIRVPAFTVNRHSRLTRKPKLYWSDTAMAFHLSGLSEMTGAHLKNLVLTDLHAWCGSRSQRPVVHHWRTASQTEVDFVVELPSGRLLPIEVKATTAPTSRDAAGLRAFLDEYGDLCSGGLLLHGGHATETLAKHIVAAPWWRVL